MDNNYIPKVVKIERIILETQDVKTFYLRYPLDFIPGQFLEVSCFGLGEVPISICSGPKEEFLKISFKRMGYVTTGLFNLKEKDSLGIRGPFGNGFPLEQLDGRDIIFIAGGIGIAPLRSLLKFIFSKGRDKTNNIVFLYGVRTPKDILYKKALKDWQKHINLLLTVDKPDVDWRADVGVVTELLDKIKIEPSKTKAILCGPEIMLHFATQKLVDLGVGASDIILSLERHMKCGIGKCGHCYISDKFVCRDGPVFTYKELNSLIPIEVLS